MFATEDSVQAAMHENPELLLSGIPDINPEYCPDAPSLVPLGREIQLASGPIDNLFIDVNAILTFVECKRYSDARIKREVYPQALNYASDLRAQLIHFDGEDFHRELFELLRSGQATSYESLDEMVTAVAADPVIEGKNTSEWRRQFYERLEHNIKSGVCRIVLLCAPAPNNTFNYRAIRNLMQLMSFSEQSASAMRYDLILMDLREERDALVSRIIWRRHATLPQIPLIAESSRDTSAGIDRMKQREFELPNDQSVALKQFLTSLSAHGLLAAENTSGYALISENTRRSVYTKIMIGDGSWTVVRHQIRAPEPFFDILEAGDPLPLPEGFTITTRLKASTLGNGRLYDVELSPTESTAVEDLTTAVLALAKSD